MKSIQLLEKDVGFLLLGLGHFVESRVLVLGRTDFLEEVQLFLVAQYVGTVEVVDFQLRLLLLEKIALVFLFAFSFRRKLDPLLARALVSLVHFGCAVLLEARIVLLFLSFPLFAAIVDATVPLLHSTLQLHFEGIQCGLVLRCAGLQVLVQDNVLLGLLLVEGLLGSLPHFVVGLRTDEGLWSLCVDLELLEFVGTVGVFGLLGNEQLGVF